MYGIKSSLLIFPYTESEEMSSQDVDTVVENGLMISV